MGGGGGEEELWTGNRQDLEVRPMEFPSGWEAGDEGSIRIQCNSLILDLDSWVSMGTVYCNGSVALWLSHELWTPAGWVEI